MVVSAYGNKGRVNGYDGSLAYDLDDFNSGDLAYAPLPEESRRELREKAQRANHYRRKQSLAPGAVLGAAVAAVLIVCVLFAQVRLMAVTAGSAALSESISQLREENTKLRIAYESEFNLSDIETYATSVLGMREPADDQIVYIESSAADKAVVLQQGSGNRSFAEKFTVALSSMAEYFR